MLEKIKNLWQKAEFRAMLTRLTTVALLVVLVAVTFYEPKEEKQTPLTPDISRPGLQANLEPEELVADDVIIKAEEESVLPFEIINKAEKEDEVNKSDTEKDKAKAEDDLRIAAVMSGKEGLPYPADGGFLRGFGFGFDKTWKEHRMHTGSDMPLAVGASVYAVTDGEVASIEEVFSWGQVITINHADGLTSIYKCVSPLETIKIGDKIGEGEAIGEITPPPLAESEEEPHLHFELKKDSKYIDPQLYVW